jgi:GNAT superfamily N-acetyltransferase
MRRWSLTADRADEAAEALARAFAPHDPLRTYLAPDPADGPRVNAVMFRLSIAAGLADGRVDVWGDPIVGVAIWLPRPAIGEGALLPAPPVPGAYEEFGPEVVERIGRVREVMQRLRAIARPDRHVYLDEVGVIPEHQRHGVATALLEAGHDWANTLGLPCALDADVEANVAFYRGRGYEVIARERVPESVLTITAMRRPFGGAG